MEKLSGSGVPKPGVGLGVPTGYSFIEMGTQHQLTLATLFIAQAARRGAAVRSASNDHPDWSRC